MIYLNGLFSINPLGVNLEEQLDSLQKNVGKYMVNTQGYLPKKQECFLGKLPFLDGVDNRNLELSLKTLEGSKDVIKKAQAKFNPKRIGLVIGSSTYQITQVEEFAKKNFNEENQSIPFNQNLYEIGILSEILKEKFNLSGPSYTIATACSSASRAIITGARLLNSDICDAVIVGASDSLSLITVSGFDSLGALSHTKAKPFSSARTGINIGEAAGFCVMSKEALEEKPLKLLGYGTSSDAHHISAPREDGLIAAKAVNDALKIAKLSPSDISYVNVHGTGTKLNDSMEGNVIRNVFGANTLFSSTKHLTGHTLAASGIVEAYIIKLILEHNLDLPYHDYEKEDYKEFNDLSLVTKPHVKTQGKIMMSNNFAFGGNNASLIFRV